ncbi:MAG: penicillin-binding protein 2 [Verrucomicrobia bacterium]|nr:penicillin-binding protein 2 [Verrucomicrobiota bacterium]
MPDPRKPGAAIVMMDTAWSLESWLTAERVAGWMPWLKLAFWLLLALFILLALGYGLRGEPRKTISKSYRILCSLLILWFAGILAYQATWQLAGFARPEFVKFQRHYNRRPNHPAARIVRGSILDVQGVPLAVSDPARPGQRVYPEGPAFCHLLGYDHPVYGLAGIEAAEQGTLSGITRDAGPEWESFRRHLTNRDELRGTNITLTVSAALQREVHALMQGRKGAVVALDPNRGDILVLHSAPGYDPNQMSPGQFERQEPEARMLNRALQGLYPAGSTFKVLVAAAALERGLNPSLDCPGTGYQAGTGSQPIRDHEYYEYQRRGQTWPGYGTLDLRGALAKSSNVYFARLGVMIGGETLRTLAVRSGLTQSWILHEGSSGNLASAPGRIPSLSNRDLARTAQISIGQGELLVTPIYLALLAGSIGHDGVLVPPRLSPVSPSRVPLTVMSPDTARRLAGMMRHTVTSGTGRAADLAGLSVAGKTGTAQNPHGADHGWFIGFAPASRPRLAFAVIVEQGGYGAQSALPVATGLLRKAQALGWFNEPARKPEGN